MRSYTQKELDEIARKESEESWAKSQIEDLDDEIERLSEMKKKLTDWLESDRSESIPEIPWEKYPNG